MRPKLPILVLATVAFAGMATAAPTFPDQATYGGTLKGKVKALVPGVKPLKFKAKNPGTTFELDGPAGKFTVRTGDVTLIGTMIPGAKPGRFESIQPVGEDLDVLIAGVEDYFDTNSSVGVTVTGVEVTGGNSMKKAGAAVTSAFVLQISGTTDLLSLPFTATAKMKFKGPRAAN